MMVPMADFMNHLPIDTSNDCFNKDFPNRKVNVDHSSLYPKEFLENLDPESELIIRGAPSKSDKVRREDQI